MSPTVRPLPPVLEGGHARAPRALPVIAAALAVMALIPLGPPALRAAFVGATWLAVPGLLLASRLARGESAAWRTTLALAWSPFLAGAPTALLAGIGVPFATAARTVTIAIATWALFECFLSMPAAPRGGPRGSRAVAWVATLGAAGVLLMHAARPALSQRSDGAFHSAVLLSVLRTGVPPEDPFFAGMRLLYFWGTHVWGAAWVALVPGLQPWTPFVALTVSATLLSLLAIGLLAQRLGAKAPAIVLAAVLAMFGAAPFAWVWVAARAMAGDVKGLPELSRLLGGGVDPALRTMSEGLLHPSLVLPADKFIVITPFAIGIGSSAILTLAALRILDRPGLRAGAVLGLSVAAAFFAHPLAAATALAAGACAWLVVSDRAFGGERGARTAAIGLVASAAAGFVLALPYLGLVSLGSYGMNLGGTPALGARALWSLVVGGALVVPVACWWLATRGQGNERRMLLASAAVLAAGALVFDMRGDNQSKLLNLLFFLLSPAAAVGWIELARRASPARRALVAALLILAVAPTVLFCAWSYATEGAGSADSPQAPGPRGRALLAALPHIADPGAVLVDGTLDSTSRVASASPRIADRPLLWSGWFMALKWGYPRAELEAREHAAIELASGAAAPHVADSLLRAMDRHAWVLHPSGVADLGAFASPRWREVSRDGGYTLYRLEPPR